MSFSTIILIISGTFLLSFVITFYFFKPSAQINVDKARKKIKRIVTEAESERLKLKSRTLEQTERFKILFKELKAREEMLEFKAQKTTVLLEERLKAREFEGKNKQEELDNEQSKLLRINNETEELLKQKTPILVKISGKKPEILKEHILQNLNIDLEKATEERLKKTLEYTNEHAKNIAKNILIEAIHRYSAPTSVEKKNLIIPINRNETKAKIIGKNCEIIDFIENELGVDILFENDKGVSISHFELIKKHIARETILKLIKDRVVDLNKAKQRLEEARAESEEMLLNIGNLIVQKLNLEYRKFPDEFKRLLGRLKFRTSYGQNILKHCFEVSYFTLLLGNEIGLNEEICKIGGFFHDLGKAIDQQDGRQHDILTKEIMEKFKNFSSEEIHAAWTHHDAVPIETAEALLVKAGDAISAGRPGARQETIEKYLERVMAVEKIAKSYEGVNKSYAISGGRELRVIVDPKLLNDEVLPELAKEIAEEIEKDVSYPGQIKVNVIRRVKYSRTIKDKVKDKIKK